MSDLARLLRERQKSLLRQRLLANRGLSGEEDEPGIGELLRKMGALHQDEVLGKEDVKKPGVIKTAVAGAAEGVDEFTNFMASLLQGRTPEGFDTERKPVDIQGPVADATAPLRDFNQRVTEDRAIAGGNPVVTAIAESAGEMADLLAAGGAAGRRGIKATLDAKKAFSDLPAVKGPPVKPYKVDTSGVADDLQALAGLQDNVDEGLAALKPQGVDRASLMEQLKGKVSGEAERVRHLAESINPELGENATLAARNQPAKPPGVSQRVWDAAIEERRMMRAGSPKPNLVERELLNEAVESAGPISNPLAEANSAARSAKEAGEASLKEAQSITRGPDSKGPPGGWNLNEPEKKVTLYGTDLTDGPTSAAGRGSLYGYGPGQTRHTAPKPAATAANSASKRAELAEGKRVSEGRLRGYFSSKGNVGDVMRDIAATRDYRIRYWTEKAEAVRKTLYKAAKRVAKEENVGIENILEGVDNALRGDMSAVHPDLADIVKETRGMVDNFSDDIAATIPQDVELREVILGNKGEYLHRSYERFHNKNWAKDVQGTQIWRDAEDFFRKQAPDLTSEEITGELMALASDTDGFASFAGRKGTEILKRRKNIPIEIRRLMGEERDPGVNFVRSITKMGQRVETHNAIKELLDQGLSQGTLQRTMQNDQFVPVGLFKDELGQEIFASDLVAKELKYRLGSGLIDPGEGALTRGVRKVVVAPKVAKTVLSLPSAARNFISSAGLYVKNGNGLLPTRRHLKDLLVAVNGAMGGDSTNKYANAYRELIKLGVVQDGSRARTIQAQMSLATGKGALSKHAIRGLPGKALDIATDVFTFGDDFFKIASFSAEKAKYGKAWKAMGRAFDEEELIKHAAKITRDTMPSYSMAPKAIDELRLNPYLGSFPNFPAEIARNTKNTLGLIVKEMSTPGLREIGTKRAAGLITAFSTPTLAGLAAAGFDVDEYAENRDAVRSFLPFWAKNSNSPVLKVDRETGEAWYLDTSFIDPLQTVKAPLMAWLKSGQPMDLEGIQAGIIEAFNQNIGTEMAPLRAAEAALNTNSYGQKITKRDDIEGFNERLRYFLWSSDGKRYDGAFVPGTATALQKIAEEPSWATVASFGGFRVQKIDIKKALGQEGWRMAEALSGIKEPYKKALKDGDPAKVIEARNKMEADWEVLREQTRETVHHARDLGVPPGDIVNALVATGISKRHAMSYLSDSPFVLMTPQEEISSRLSTARRALALQ